MKHRPRSPSSPGSDRLRDARWTRWSRGPLVLPAGAAALALALTGACSSSVPGTNPEPPAPSDDAPDPTPNDPCGQQVFNFTETQEALVVPDNVNYMHVKLWGAGGNGEGYCRDPGDPDQEGGLGGYTEAVFAVESGDSLLVIVGKGGRRGLNGGTDEATRFGFGAWGGGGLSGVFTGGELITEADSERALAIAGGGGSAGVKECAPGGTGNHANAGGESTMLGSMGDADGGVNGGGGGYEGGTGGSGNGPGAGGKGYVSPDATDQYMESSEPGTKLPPQVNDADYEEEVGTTERDGLVVVRFECGEPQIQVD